jgi:hypothetical protein
MFIESSAKPPPPDPHRPRKGLRRRGRHRRHARHVHVHQVCRDGHYPVRLFYFISPFCALVVFLEENVCFICSFFVRLEEEEVLGWIAPGHSIICLFGSAIRERNVLSPSARFS